MMKKTAAVILLILLFDSLSSYSQKKENDYRQIVELCSFDSIIKNLVEFEKQGIKEINTNALKNTARWLEGKYRDYGYSEIERDTFFFGGDTLFNLVVTKKGILYPDSFLVICGHYDTSNGTGVNDNGSGTCIILEMARILKKINTNISVLFIHFSGEEAGLVGSSHYVNQVLGKQNLKIKLVFNIDAVGGVASRTNNTIVCEFDKDNRPAENNEQSLNFTKLLANYIENYTDLKTATGKAYGSDYMAFEDQGYIISGLYEYNKSPFAHTSDDVVENVDLQYIYQVAKGALGAALHFSTAD